MCDMTRDTINITQRSTFGNVSCFTLGTHIFFPLSEESEGEFYFCDILSVMTLQCCHVVMGLRKRVPKFGLFEIYFKIPRKLRQLCNSRRHGSTNRYTQLYLCEIIYRYTTVLINHYKYYVL